VTKKTENELVIRIRDNGKGMSQEKWNDKNTLGLNGIKSRVNYLNGEIKLVEDSGTHFKITVPLV
jgi:signal transduction histidine kinase